MNEFHEGLAEILEVPPAEIQPGFSLLEHGWDSLAIISCVVLIDECFGRLVPGCALAACRTVADLDALALQDAAA